MTSSLIAMIQSAMEPVSWALLHSLWQGGLIALALAVVLALVNNRSAKLRYALSCAALAGVLIMFVGTAVYLGNNQTGSYTSGQGSVETTASATVVDQHAETTATGTQSSPKTQVLIINESGTGGSQYALMERLESLTPYIFQIWLVGVLMLSAWHLLGWRKAQQLTMKGAEPASPEWQEKFFNLCRNLNVNTRVELLQSAIAKSPCVVGWFKPVVLVPISTFAGLSADQVELIIVHELAHIRRYDVLVNYLQTAVETLLFFNPATWWISRQIRVEREHCCDDMSVETCGNRLKYARALADLESLRSNVPALAPAADGTPIVERIRRLAGRPALQSRSRGIGLVSSIMFTVFLTVGVGTIGGLNPDEAVASPDNDKSSYVEAPDDYHGDWEAEKDDDEIEIDMWWKHQNGNHSIRIYPEDIEKYFTETDDGFKLTYDAGTIFFEGKLDQGKRRLIGEGECHFRPDPEFADKIKALGIRRLRESQHFFLGIHGVQLGWIEDIVDRGYKRLSVDDLIEMHIHGVGPEYIDGLMELGYDDLDSEELVEMRIHGVTPKTIRKLKKSGFRPLDVDQLVTMQIHDVDLDYIEALEDLGYTNLDPDELVAMQIHNVDPDFIVDLSELGYQNIDIDDLVAMQIHNVDPDYILDLSELGYRNIDVDDLVAMHIHNVDPDYIRELTEAGYTNIDIDELVAMSIHDVNPRYIRKLAEMGYTGIDTDELVAMQIHDISPRFIEDLAELGYDDIDTDQLVAMQIHNVTPRYIKSLAEVGYTDVDPEDLVAMKIHNITPSFIEEMREDGYDYLTPKRLIKHKIRRSSRGYRW